MTDLHRARLASRGGQALAQERVAPPNICLSKCTHSCVFSISLYTSNSSTTGHTEHHGTKGNGGRRAVTTETGGGSRAPELALLTLKNCGVSTDHGHSSTTCKRQHLQALCTHRCPAATLCCLFTTSPLQPHLLPYSPQGTCESYPQLRAGPENSEDKKIQYYIPYYSFNLASCACTCQTFALFLNIS